MLRNPRDLQTPPCCSPSGSGCGRGPHSGPPAVLTPLFALVLLAVEKLAGCKLNVAEVTQSEIGQKQKLQTVLEAVHDLLRPHGWALQWTVDCESLLGAGRVRWPCARSVAMDSSRAFKAPFARLLCGTQPGERKASVPRAQHSLRAPAPPAS